jgi:septal ring factor EnvC (AmiA/AmiB activator)
VHLIAKEREVQGKLDQLRTNLAKIEESVQMKTATIRECRGKVTNISKELTAIGTGAAALEGVEQELAAAVSHMGCGLVL